MEPSIYVKVVGFRDLERHALNTLFRLSIGRPCSYGLWTPEAPVEPQLVLIDLEANAAGAALAAAGPNSGLRMICVGHGAPAAAWRTFERPLHWPDVVHAMDSLFAQGERLDSGIDFGGDDDRAGGQRDKKVSLLVDPSREDRLYLRARLALAGHTAVDDAASGAQALELAKRRHYDLVIAGLDLPDIKGWELVRQLVTLEPAIGSVVVTSADKSWHMREHAQASGCAGLLTKPYDPLQIIELLQKI